MCILIHEQGLCSSLLVIHLVSVCSFAGSIVLKITYGYTTKEQDDPLILSAEKVMRAFNLAASLDTVPWMVDLFPQCN
jgi:hypothetical protein